MSTDAPTAPRAPRKAFRSTDERLLGGVAAGLARHLGVEVIYVRGAFLLATAVGGFGAVLYAGLWLTLPTDAHLEQSTPGLEAATRQGKRRPGRTRRLEDVGLLVALGAVAIGIVVLGRTLIGGSVVFWPVLLGVIGLAVLWRQADEAQRERWIDSTGRIDVVRAVVGSGGAASWARLAGGVGLLVSALVLFALQTGQSGEIGVARDVVVAGALGVAGLALMVGPWLVRLTGDLAEERAARVRSQERADMAAHLHDSVLQTLALIQKHAADGRTVATLARAQERDLRSWLYGERGAAGHLGGQALQAAAAEVEDGHGVPVEVVTVGDTAVSDRVAAARPRRPRGDGQRREALRGRAGRRLRRVHGRSGRGLRPRPGQRLRRERGARGPARRAQQHRRTGCAGTAAPPRSAPRPARAPRSGSP